MSTINNKKYVDADKLSGTTISIIGPTTGQVLVFDGTQWGPSTVTIPSGSTGSFVMTTGVQTVSGVKTFNDSMTFAGGKQINVDRVAAVTGAGNLTIGASNPGFINVISKIVVDQAWSLQTDAISNTTPGISTTIGVNGFKFANATASYVPAPLNYYENGTLTNSWSGAIPTTSGNIRYIRTGNMVTLCFNQITVTATSTAPITNVGFELPARLCPQFPVNVTIQALSNGSWVGGQLRIATSGSITVFASWGAGASFITGFPASFTNQGITYTL